MTANCEICGHDLCHVKTEVAHIPWYTVSPENAKCKA